MLVFIGICFALHRWNKIRERRSIKSQLMAFYPKESLDDSSSSDSNNNYTQRLLSSSSYLRQLNDDIDLWDVKMSEINIVNDVVAVGGQASVSFGMWRNTAVVVKRFFEVQDFEAFQRETEVHRRLRHPNVVMLLGICSNPPAMVLELMHRGSLNDVLVSPKYSSQVDVALAIRIATDIARGMIYLHSLSIIHRDLKSFNILLDISWTAKVNRADDMM